jgi:hypothetical protein
VEEWKDMMGQHAMHGSHATACLPALPKSACPLAEHYLRLMPACRCHTCAWEGFKLDEMTCPDQCNSHTPTSVEKYFKNLFSDNRFAIVRAYHGGRAKGAVSL